MAERSLASRIFAMVDPGGRMGDVAAPIDKSIPIMFASAALVFITGTCAWLIAVGTFGTAGGLAFGAELAPALVETLEEKTNDRSVSLDELGMVAPSIFVGGGIFSAEGTGCVWRPPSANGRLWVVTNRHVLGLLGKRPRGSLPTIRIEFPTGATAIPKRVGLVDGVDLAVLEITEDELREGHDYLTLTPADDAAWTALRPSKEIAMVGSMLGLEQSRSFGRIGALRDRRLGFGAPNARWIQIDGTILPGNSGGPLLVKHDELWEWIGVNTLGHNEGGLGFALHTSEIFRHPIEWFEVPPKSPYSR